MLKEGIALPAPTNIEKQGVIKSFEFTFELCWKTLRDFFESKKVDVSYPRDVIKEAFRHAILKEGEIWMEMLDDRNLMAHTYDEAKAEEAIKKIKSHYFLAISELLMFLNKELA